MLLENINSPQDLRKLNPEQLPVVCAEIRRRIIEVVSKCGGHLASSLGAVDLIVALHYCLDTPKDKIIFDVGHQSYAHKILTGRNLNFDTLRQCDGISGFPLREESLHDAVSTGHSSTAVSVALGFACAREQMANQDNYKVVAIIGDGSLSGGLCFEGLNNAGHLKKDMLVVLNTNELSIAPNVGALSNYLNKIISQPIYNRFKNSLEGFVRSRLPKGSRLLKIANRFEEGLKGLFIPGMFFEELGFRYFGPLDGHNTNTLLTAIKNIINIKGPKLMHIVTKKGKGYMPAENDPVKFHSTGPFDIDTGKPIAKSGGITKTYTEVFSEKLIELAQKNDKILAITAAMPEGTGLEKFRNLYPSRFFDVGIAEAHAVCFAAGLARSGLKPVVAIYSTFLQRAYDQIIEEIALQNAPVVFIIDRASIGEDGVTHQGIFDIAFLKDIPNLVVMSPKDGEEFKAMLEFAINLGQPVTIRYPKSVVPSQSYPTGPLGLGRGEILTKGQDFVIVALGSMVIPCLEAVGILKKEGLSGTLINSRFVKPLDKDFFQELTAKTKFIFSAEEGIKDGGLGSALSQVLGRAVVTIGLPCQFIPHGKRELLLEKYGLTKDSIAAKIRKTLQDNG